VPSWKVVAEVNDVAKLTSALQKVAEAVKVPLTSENVNGRTFYSLKVQKIVPEIDYTFVDGYLLMAPTRALLTAALDARAAGMTLPRSSSFRNQLPADGHLDFSAVMYYNLGTTVGPLVDQLKATGLLPPEQQKQVSELTANREPSLVYVYGEPDRIIV